MGKDEEEELDRKFEHRDTEKMRKMGRRKE
jgi:hypothetical protein